MKLSIFSLLIFISFEIIAQATPYEIVQNMGRGINLGNTLSAPDEGSWAPIVHESFFEDVKNEGFSNVRIPVDFYGDRTTGSTASFSTASGTFPVPERSAHCLDWASSDMSKYYKVAKKVQQWYFVTTLF